MGENALIATLAASDIRTSSSYSVFADAIVRPASASCWRDALGHCLCLLYLDWARGVILSTIDYSRSYQRGYLVGINHVLSLKIVVQLSHHFGEVDDAMAGT